jgi:hypothetical protein
VPTQEIETGAEPAAEQRVRRRFPFRPDLQPERRTRTDVIVGVALALAVVVAFSVLAATSSVEGTTSVPAATPLTPPDKAGPPPLAFTQAWTAPSPGTRVPVVSGHAVVTAEGSTVIGHEAATGARSWSYSRDLPLCAVGAGFGARGETEERVLALYQSNSGWCSELSALRPDLGTLADTRNPNLLPGTQLISNNTYVLGTAPGNATNPGEIEVMRYDLVRTSEYGMMLTPAQPSMQPRPLCRHATTMIGPDRFGVIERCPGEATSRLTVVSTESKDDKPVVQFSVPLPPGDATVVALTADRTAVALPDPARIVVFDSSGKQVGDAPVDVSPAELTAAADSPSGTVAAVGDKRSVSWWTGSKTIFLDPAQLLPITTVPDTLGPATVYGDTALVPVPDGLAVIGAGPQPVQRVIPVERTDRTAPVRLATQGDILLEQRGSTLVALTPG